MFSSVTKAALVAFALSALQAFAAQDLSLKVIAPDTISDVDDFVVKTNKEVTVLAPGQSIEIEQDLSGVYNLNSSGAGAYEIDAKNQFLLLTKAGEVQKVSATSDSHVASFNGKLASTKQRRRFVRRAVGYNGCSSTRQSQISTAVTSANTYISSSLSYLNGLTASSPRFTTWFGTYSASKRDTVKSHYSSMSGDPSNTTYDCTCTDSAYAYVYANEPGYVYLCNAFWSAPNTGTDSRAGTIVHEQSHFTVNGGTQDYAYGQSAAKSLAINNPSQAIFNADSHEYFSENTPAQS
ncbi:hypothetical protein FRC03_004295 [Tulasnella sp. 419]|nr:hypothetical protein FRC03_004295 [Tulasnella sp. 419]